MTVYLQHIRRKGLPGKVSQPCGHQAGQTSPGSTGWRRGLANQHPHADESFLSRSSPWARWGLQDTSHGPPLRGL